MKFSRQNLGGLLLRPGTVSVACNAPGGEIKQSGESWAEKDETKPDGLRMRAGHKTSGKVRKTQRRVFQALKVAFKGSMEDRVRKGKLVF